MAGKKGVRRARKSTKPRRRHAVTRAQNARADFRTITSNLAAVTPYMISVAGVNTNARIKAIAAQYQDYRITRVDVKFLPQYNTYSGVPGGVGGFVPQLLTKTLDVPAPVAWNEAWLVQMDPKIHEIAQKDITVSYKPKVDMLAADAGGNTGVMIKSSPWLSTNANADIGGAWTPDVTAHFGLLAYIANAASVTGGVSYSAEVFYEFRKPFTQVPASNVATSTHIRLGQEIETFSHSNA